MILTRYLLSDYKNIKSDTILYNTIVIMKMTMKMVMVMVM